MADTARTKAAIQALFADNTTGDISPQDLRDFVESVANPVADGGLESRGFIDYPNETFALQLTGGVKSVANNGFWFPKLGGTLDSGFALDSYDPLGVVNPTASTDGTTWDAYTTIRLPAGLWYFCVQVGWAEAAEGSRWGGIQDTIDLRSRFDPVQAPPFFGSFPLSWGAIGGAVSIAAEIDPLFTGMMPVLSAGVQASDVNSVAGEGVAFRPFAFQDSGGPLNATSFKIWGFKMANLPA